MSERVRVSLGWKLRGWWDRKTGKLSSYPEECGEVAQGITQNGVHPVCQRKPRHLGLHRWDDPRSQGSASWSP